MNYEKKRGQISIFFMVGFALLILLIVVLFMRSKQVDIVDAVVIPVEILPAKNFIDFCMDSVSTEALYILGRQGGFINIRPEVEMDPSRRITFGGGAEIVPYWYYENMNFIPSQGFMEEELKGYINENFIKCVNEIDFPTKGFKIKTFTDNSTTNVRINAKDVSVEIQYLVEISTTDDTIKTKIPRFYSVYDVKLLDMVELAKNILAYENNNYFLEGLTVELMSINDDIPLSGMITECGVRTWQVEDVKRSLQLMILNTLTELKVGGTDYYPFIEDEDLYRDYQDYGRALKEAYEEITLVDNLDEPGDYERALQAAAAAVGKPNQTLPSDAYYFSHYFMDVHSSDLTKFKNFSVDFLYLPEFGMDFQAKPSSDGVMKSNSVEGFQKYLSFFCINIYSFTYDATYPILVVLNDPDALYKTGYSFRYSFPVLVHNNEGLRSKQHITVDPSSTTKELYCLFNNKENQAYVRAYDSTFGTASYMEGVNISMLCANRKCPLGTTKPYGGDMLLKTNITTSCSNPYIVAEKPGYFTGVYLLDDNIIDGKEVYIEMIRMKNFTVDVKKHSLDLSDGSLGPAKTVNDGRVSIYISGILKNRTYDYSTVIDNGEIKKIELPITDATYDVAITYLKNLEDFSGGYYGTWNVSKGELISGNKVTFHLTELITTTLDEDTAEAVGMLHNTTSPKLLPEIQ